MTSLLDAVRRHSDANADHHGIARTSIPGLTTIRALAPTDLMYAISCPLVALVVQGAKHVTMGIHGFDFAAGDSLLITADVPTTSRITRASPVAPYYSLVLELNPAVIAELCDEMKLEPVADTALVRVDPTEAEVADAALRLMHLFCRPASIPVLAKPLVREMHYWLLAGRHGSAIRRLGWPEGHAQRIGRAVAALRIDFAKPLRIEQLAALASMSPSSFHKHFRAVTTLSPLQFQKRLRLIEARRMMLTEGRTAGHAAFAVGYESVSQFTREYGRFFGQPPVRDVRAVRDRGFAA